MRVTQDIINENNAINMQSIQNWASGSKNAPTANHNCSVFLAHKPSVVLAQEEAAGLEAVNTPKQTWPRMELHK